MDSHQIINSTKERMNKAIKVSSEELSGVRTGRATTTILDRITVDYYGTKTPLRQLSSINVPEKQTITIQPWDKNSIPAIEKAIMESDLGLTPGNDGNIIRLSIPPLTEERRKELVKIVHHIAEEGRVAIRNIRRDANEHLKREQKEGKISEDDYYRNHDQIQKFTDEHIENLDDMMKNKEQEVMEV